MSFDPEMPEPPPRYEPPAPPNRAEVRPGNVAPHPPATTPGWAAAGRLIDETLPAVRDLVRIARYPHQHPLWQILKPNLLRIEAALQKSLDDQPDDPVASVTLQEVQRYLHRKIT